MEETPNEAGAADTEDGEESLEHLESLESLNHSAEIAAIERRVQEIEAEMARSEEGLDPVTQAFRLPCSAHKVSFDVCFRVFVNIVVEGSPRG